MSMAPLVALLLSAADLAAGTGAVPEAAAAPPMSMFALTVGLGGDVGVYVAGLQNGSLGGDLEFSVRPLRWLRFEVLSGAAWAPPWASYPGQHGIFRALGGADLLAPWRGGDLFVGLAGGVQHMNLFVDEDVLGVGASYMTGWATGFCFMARSGAEFRVHEHLTVGAVLAYSFFHQPNFGENRHAVELHARVSFVF